MKEDTDQNLISGSVGSNRCQAKVECLTKHLFKKYVFNFFGMENKTELPERQQ